MWSAAGVDDQCAGGDLVTRGRRVEAVEDGAGPLERIAVCAGIKSLAGAPIVAHARDPTDALTAAAGIASAIWVVAAIAAGSGLIVLVRRPGE